MKYRPVQSSSIVQAGYDPAERVLEVEFASGKTYRYLDVDTDLGEDFFEAPSAGKFLSRYIMGHHDFKQVG